MHDAWTAAALANNDDASKEGSGDAGGQHEDCLTRLGRLLQESVDRTAAVGPHVAGSFGTWRLKATEDELPDVDKRLGRAAAGVPVRPATA